MAVDELIKDVVIIGGGPAGMSAALWCAELGLKPLIIDASHQLGGQLSWIHNKVSNYLGGKFVNGEEIRAAFERSLDDVKFEHRFSRPVVDLDVRGRKVMFADGTNMKARALVIATGVRRRELGVPGEREFIGKGILMSGMGERDNVLGKRVAIIGGGDAALENALILAEPAQRVFLIHRRDSFKGRREFIDQVRSHPKIETIMNGRVENFVGKATLEGISVLNQETSEVISIDNAIVRIGVEPNSEIAGDHIDTDEKGYIIVDNQCRTSAARVWAIGDVANPVSPTIATAVGSGATCAKSIEKFVRENESRSAS